MADERCRLTGMLPGALLGPDSPGNDRFPVTTFRSGVDISEDW